MSLLHLLECHGGDVIDRTEMVFYLSDTPHCVLDISVALSLTLTAHA